MPFRAAALALRSARRSHAPAQPAVREETQTSVAFDPMSAHVVAPDGGGMPGE